MNEFDLTLDLNKSRAASPVRLRQGDLQGTTVRALILDHGATADLTGMTAQWVMDLPDGTHYYRKGGAVSGNVVSVLINEAQAASVTGRTLAYVQLLQGSTVRASTGSVVVEILPDALADATVPESYDSAIQDAIDALDAAVEQMPDMVEDVLADHPEWTTTVQDGSITAPKLATDLARDRERLMYRLDNLLTATLPEGETATATDAAKTPLAGLALYGRSTQDGTPTPSAPVAIQSVGGNLYQQTMFAAGTTRTTGGVEVTYNEDGTCTVSGTATSNAWLWGGSSSSDARLYVTLPAGTYTICGSHSVIAQKMVGGTVSNIVSQTMRQATFTLTEETLVKAVPVIPSGTTVSGETAWVALYRGSTAYPYVPYGNVGLRARGRNLLSSGTTKTVSGITYTVNADGSVNASGTASARSDFQFVTSLPLAAGTYTLSGAPQGGAGKWNLRLDRMSDNSNVALTEGNPTTFTLTEETSVYADIRVYNGQTVNITFYPQLEMGSTATAYQPYEQTVTPIDLDGHELRSLPDGTRDELTVDERGHAVLVQRVGHVVLDGSSDENYTLSGNKLRVSYTNVSDVIRRAPNGNTLVQLLSDRFVAETSNQNYAGNVGASIGTEGYIGLCRTGAATTVAAEREWLASNPTTVDYPLATPVTIDLGTIDPVPLVGPDLTAQAVPSAPMQLTYERDLNVTLARLESAIATLV